MVIEQNHIVPANIDILPTDIERAIENAKLQRAALDRFLKDVLVSGVDYDRVPGTDKPTLLKSGAEMLCNLFRLSPGKLEVLHVERDLERNFISYDVGMHIIHRDSGLNVAYGVGAANSYEKKYRWRKTKDADGNDIQIQNPDIMDQHNTFLKMAAKRALVDGVLKATGASRLFTQDMEDFGIPEGPSKKQIDLVKKICKGKTEQEILAGISEFFGREIQDWSDLTRQEVSEWIDKNKPTDWGRGSGGNGSSRGTGNGNGQKYSCSSCGGDIPQAVHAYSSRHFGKPLCRDCQKAAKTNGQNSQGSGLNWGSFWAQVKHIDEMVVHDEARKLFDAPDLQSLTEVIKNQEQLDDFLDYLKRAYAA